MLVSIVIIIYNKFVFMLREPKYKRDGERDEFVQCSICREMVCRGQECTTDDQVKDCTVMNEIEGIYGLFDTENLGDSVDSDE